MATILFIKNTVKVLIGAGAVYITLSEGIWSTSADGSEAAKRLRTSVLPATDQYLEKMPSATCVSKCAVNTWNSGIQKSFSALSNAPETICRYSHQVVEQIKQKKFF
jgi:hypothetical protein